MKKQTGPPTSTIITVATVLFISTAITEECKTHLCSHLFSNLAPSSIESLLNFNENS